ATLDPFALRRLLRRVRDHLRDLLGGGRALEAQARERDAEAAVVPVRVAQAGHREAAGEIDAAGREMQPSDLGFDVDALAGGGNAAVVHDEGFDPARGRTTGAGVDAGKEGAGEEVENGARDGRPRGAARGGGGEGGARGSGTARRWAAMGRTLACPTAPGC